MAKKWHVTLTYSAGGRDRSAKFIPLPWLSPESNDPHSMDGPQLNWGFELDDVEAETAEEAIRIAKRELRRIEPAVYEMSRGGAVPAHLYPYGLHR